jgi:hypothetical protein
MKENQMATTSIIMFDSFDLNPLESMHRHHDPDPAIPFEAFVQVMVRPIPTGGAGEGDGGVVRAENFKGQLVLDPSTLQPTIRWHYDVINESNIPIRCQTWFLIVIP